MADIKEIRIIDVPLDQVEVGDRVRKVDPSAVNIIAMSITDLGLITSPIHLRKVKGSFRLIDGAHRYSAAVQLGMTEIPAKIWECTADQAELMESDANISTAHTSPLDLAVSLAARKRTYQKLHPETRRGTAGSASRWGHKMQETEMSFASWMGDVYGVTARQVNRIIAAGDNLTPEEVAALREAPQPVKMADLYVISKADPTQRNLVCKALSEGKAKNAASALKSIKSNGVQPPVKDPVEEAFAKLRETWGRAPRAARRRFVETYAEDLAELLPNGDDA